MKLTIEIDIRATSQPEFYKEFKHVLAQLVDADVDVDVDHKIGLTNTWGNDIGAVKVMSNLSHLRYFLPPWMWSHIEGINEAQTLSAIRVLERQQKAVIDANGAMTFPNRIVSMYLTSDKTLMMNFPHIIIGVEEDGYAHS